MLLLRGEVLSLGWHEVRPDVDVSGLLLGHQERTVPDRAPEREGEGGSAGVGREVGELEARTRESEYVFPSRQGMRKGHLFDLRKPFEKACREAEIENFRIHDLRHTFASMAVKGGASLFDVQKLLGHQDIAMTQRYAHLSADGLRRPLPAGVATLRLIQQ